MVANSSYHAATGIVAREATDPIDPHLEAPARVVNGGFEIDEVILARGEREAAGAQHGARAVDRERAVGIDKDLA